MPKHYRRHFSSHASHIPTEGALAWTGTSAQGPLHDQALQIGRFLGASAFLLLKCSIWRGSGGRRRHHRPEAFEAQIPTVGRRTTSYLSYGRVVKRARAQGWFYRRVSRSGSSGLQWKSPLFRGAEHQSFRCVLWLGCHSRRGTRQCCPQCFAVLGCRPGEKLKANSSKQWTMDIIVSWKIIFESIISVIWSAVPVEDVISCNNSY